MRRFGIKPFVFFFKTANASNLQEVPSQSNESVPPRESARLIQVGCLFC